ncbi:MAG: hypothetical protein ACRDHE_12045 [Ktedonobacterales bacterium]
MTTIFARQRTLPVTRTVALELGASVVGSLAFEQQAPASSPRAPERHENC